MHPPFVFTDHKVLIDPHQHRKKPMLRHAPEPLQLTLPTVGWPPIPLAVATITEPLASGAQTVSAGVRLQVDPPPRKNLRDVIGRWLIHIGQRMILENRLG